MASEQQLLDYQAANLVEPMLVEVRVKAIEEKLYAIRVEVQRRNQEHDSEVEEEYHQHADHQEAHPRRVCFECSQTEDQTSEDGAEDNTLQHDCQGGRYAEQGC